MGRVIRSCFDKRVQKGNRRERKRGGNSGGDKGDVSGWGLGEWRLDG